MGNRAFKYEFLSCCFHRKMSYWVSFEQLLLVVLVSYNCMQAATADVHMASIFVIFGLYT